VRDRSILVRYEKPSVIFVFLLAVSILGCGDDPVGIQPPAELTAVQWVSLNTALGRAYQENKHIVLYFEVEWSGWVDVMDRQTLAAPEIISLLNASFLAVRIDADSAVPIPLESGSTSGQQLAEDYQVTSFPTTWFLNPVGERIGSVPGFQNPSRFLEYLEYIRDRKYEDIK